VDKATSSVCKYKNNKDKQEGTARSNATSEKTELYKLWNWSYAAVAASELA